jgi:hypothetical protein
MAKTSAKRVAKKAPKKAPKKESKDVIKKAAAVLLAKAVELARVARENLVLAGLACPKCRSTALTIADTFVAQGSPRVIVRCNQCGYQP